MEDNRKIDNVDSQENGLGRGEFAVNAKEDNREGNDAEFPDPETVTVECNDGPDDGVELDSAVIQDDRCKQRVENI